MKQQAISGSIETGTISKPAQNYPTEGEVHHTEMPVAEEN